MSEVKNKKNPLLPLVLVTLAFIAIIGVSMHSVLKTGKGCAETAAQEKYISIAAVCAIELRSSLDTFLEDGPMIAEYMESNFYNVNSSRVVGFAHNLVLQRPYYRMMLCSADGSAVDDMGVSYDVSSYAEYMKGFDSTKTGYYFFKYDNMGISNVIVTTYPLPDGDYLLFFNNVSELSSKYQYSGAEDNSFALVFGKDGSRLSRISTYKDHESPFLQEVDFLNTIQKSTSKRAYNPFKTKLYSDIGCAISCEYNEDERTICCVPLGINDWYVGLGVRQEVIDVQVANDFSQMKSAVIRAGIVLLIFVAYVLIYLIVNICKSKEKGKKLADKADIDLLTELTNKGATERLISEYIEEHPSGNGVLFILDIDNFKKINDTMGHAFGDTLLKTLGKEIRTEFRVTDIVGRTGGDEFMIFLKDINDDLIVEREANRLTRFFHDFKAGGDYVKHSATASIGAALYPSDGETFKDLYVSADQALYRAKKRGKNQLVFYNEDRYEQK